MSVFNTNPCDQDLIAIETATMPIFLDKNWQTTAAAAVAVATGGMGAGLLLAAFPAQTVAATATVGGLAYAGHRREQGLDPVPFLDKLFKKGDKQEPEATA